MMNDRVLYELLYQYIRECIAEDWTIDEVINAPKTIWEMFWVDSSNLKGRYSEIWHLIGAIAKDVDRKDRMHCQYCRIDEGLFVESPVQAENLCKRHRQEYEEQYIDRTLRQIDFGEGTIAPTFNRIENG